MHQMIWGTRATVTGSLRFSSTFPLEVTHGCQILVMARTIGGSLVRLGILMENQKAAPLQVKTVGFTFSRMLESRNCTRQLGGTTFGILRTSSRISIVLLAAYFCTQSCDVSMDSMMLRSVEDARGKWRGFDDRWGFCQLFVWCR